MTKFLAPGFAVLAVLMGCGDGHGRTAQGPPASGETNPAFSESARNFECRPGDETPSSYPAFSPRATAHVAFQCLDFADKSAFEATPHDYHVIDIEPGVDGEGASAGVLQIALHEVKTKAFLRGRKVAIVSNGKRFGAIERECAAIRKSGITDVVALLDTSRVSPEQTTISARDFVAERPYGIWRVDNRTSKSERDSALLMDAAGIEPVLARQQQRDGHSGLVRTLVVLDSADEAERSDSRGPTGIGYSFVLEGGIEGLRQFEMQASAMARAQAQPRIGERGCRG